MAMNLTVPIK
jgi:hypothetical protein